jgi:hypothetical protein
LRKVFDKQQQQLLCVSFIYKKKIKMNEMSLKYSVAWISRNIVLGLEQRLVGLFNVRLECVEKAKDNRLVGKISVINNVSREIVIMKLPFRELTEF